jgi:hypothetical protein
MYADNTTHVLDHWMLMAHNYLRANPAQDLDENLTAEKALFAMLGADSDGEDGPAGGGADPAEATPQQQKIGQNMQIWTICIGPC